MGCLIPRGAEEPGVNLMTAPVELNQPRDLSKAVVVVEVVLSSKVLPRNCGNRLLCVSSFMEPSIFFSLVLSVKAAVEKRRGGWG